MHPFGQLLCLSRTLFWKKILVGDDSPPYKDMNWIICLKNSRLCPIRTLRTSSTKQRTFFIKMFMKSSNTQSRIVPKHCFSCSK
jgi:hypothetical protein